MRITPVRNPNDQYAAMISYTQFAPESVVSQVSESGPTPTGAVSIHPDFRSVKEHGHPLDGWSAALRSGFLRTVNMFHRRKFRRLTSEIVIPGRDGNRLSLVIIRPDGLPSRSPALIYYHGDAFVGTHLPQHLANAVRYGLESRCLVIFASYRLAPRHSFTLAFNDCFAVLRWAISNPDRLGIDRARIAVGGDSSGATLAAAVTRKAVHEHQVELCAQVLIYPTADGRRKTQSPVASFNVAKAQRGAASAVGGAPVRDPSVASLHRFTSPDQGNLRGLPPTYVELAEVDMMRDEGKEYAEAMRSSGVQVELNEVSGAIHSFDLLVPKSDISMAAVDRRIQFLRRAFAGPICPTFRTRRTLASQSLAQRQGDLKPARTSARS